ncbi:helix-turn-helix domain-containing protein [Nonomuraea sp. NPDC050790]|uniref:helix-turn-helix domain-containing protein n=1 Tax=Nonomuraea sp. NPDC050790 TaxID=3364371 RepID=UPI00378908D1
MVRPPLTPEERLRGEHLGLLLRQARGPRSIAEVAAAAGMSAETLRKIETGRIATPAFFTIASLATVLGISLDALAPPHPGDLGERSSGWARMATSSSPGSSSR